MLLGRLAAAGRGGGGAARRRGRCRGSGSGAAGGCCRSAAAEPAARPLVPILFYRSMLLAADHAPVEALAAALEAEGIEALPVFVPSLRDAAVAGRGGGGAGAARAGGDRDGDGVRGGGGRRALFDRLGVPVFQVVPATTRREAWAGGARGLAPADLAMHVVLPELDGRVLAGAVSFKERPSATSGSGSGCR